MGFNSRTEVSKSDAWWLPVIATKLIVEDAQDLSEETIERVFKISVGAKQCQNSARSLRDRGLLTEQDLINKNFFLEFQ